MTYERKLFFLSATNMDDDGFPERDTIKTVEKESLKIAKKVMK